MVIHSALHIQQIYLYVTSRGCVHPSLGLHTAWLGLLWLGLLWLGSAGLGSAWRPKTRSQRLPRRGPGGHRMPDYYANFEHTLFNNFFQQKVDFKKHKTAQLIWPARTRPRRRPTGKLYTILAKTMFGNFFLNKWKIKNTQDRSHNFARQETAHEATKWQITIRFLQI